MNLRIGNGFDSHRLVEGRDFILGGIKIPYERGLAGHSDGDALIHAIIDALLGAIAFGDIGELFPDNDPQYKNIQSDKLLHETLEHINKACYRINNLDCTIICEAPKLSPYKKNIINNLAGLMSIEPTQVSIKAKTAEQMGAFGRGEGIAVIATVLIEKLKSLETA